MKYLLSLLSLAFYINGCSVATKEIKKEINDEFKYIKPIAVEEAPLIIVKKEAVKKELDQEEVTSQEESLDDGWGNVLDDGDTLTDTLNEDDGDSFMDTLNADEIQDDGDIPIDALNEDEMQEEGINVDIDGDGVVNSKDQCPDTDKSFNVDKNGCPQTATLKVNFKPNKHKISKELIKELQNFAKFLKDNLEYDVIIYGYTDNTGDEEVNQMLSQNRANTVMEAIASYGVDDMRLTPIGKGEANPIADNIDEDGRAKNRRIEVELIK